MKSYKITNPIRFFGFFGLFLIFMFMAVKSCTDRKTKTDFVTAKEISKSVEAESEDRNSEELEEFIEDVKESIDQEKAQAKAKTEEKEPEANNIKIDSALKKTEEKRKSEPSKKPVKNKKGPEPKVKPLNAVVKGNGTEIDSFSKIQLKKSVSSINKAKKGSITVYGSYYPGEAKSKGFIRAAKIKNELIRFGIKNSITVYILPESQSRRDLFGRIKFK